MNMCNIGNYKLVEITLEELILCLFIYAQNICF